MNSYALAFVVTHGIALQQCQVPPSLSSKTRARNTKYSVFLSFAFFF